ncbi:YkgJ family cysteine cluster protein [Methanolobus bombayensis]|uniref:YkgJ family cysteine cluster protein n=1 Tax=Methanolobus bombayensis TaxID=38023 RepID=UPI001AE89B0B|nr:YkgJ family cysteine cluster protein [Methanolobus bombayensis]MBP1908501.1 Fe-S-cluster containining protein [Methanolobus bombayensis]
MEISAAVKKSIRYSVVQNILKHYPCPDTCGAHCCCNGQIHFFEDEVKILTVIDSEKAKKITNEGLCAGLYQMNVPCSFLNASGRCGVYENRPTVCGMYPFKVNTSGNSVGLQPCPVGFLIIRDFAELIVGSFSKSKASDEDKTRIKEEWQKSVALYEAELVDFHSKSILKEMQIPFDELEIFSMFLSSKKAKNS